MSAHAGQTTFWASCNLRKVRALLDALMPHRLTSPNAHDPAETALGFGSVTAERSMKVAVDFSPRIGKRTVFVA